MAVGSGTGDGGEGAARGLYAGKGEAEEQMEEVGDWVGRQQQQHVSGGAAAESSRLWGFS